MLAAVLSPEKTKRSKLKFLTTKHFSKDPASQVLYLYCLQAMLMERRGGGNLPIKVLSTGSCKNFHHFQIELI